MQKFKIKTKRKWSTTCFYRIITAISKKDWKTYARFLNCLITEMPKIAALPQVVPMGKKQLLKVFKEMRTMLYFLGALFFTNEILRIIWRNASLVQKVSTYFWKRHSTKHDQVFLSTFFNFACEMTITCFFWSRRLYLLDCYSMRFIELRFDWLMIWSLVLISYLMIWF